MSATVPLRRRLPLVPLAVTTVLGLVLAGCSGDGEPRSQAGGGSPGSPEAATPSADASSDSPTESGSASSAESESASPTRSATGDVSVPEGVTLTPEGTDLRFGDEATVAFEPDRKRSGLLELTVRSARTGDLDDFGGFILDDKYKRRASYYYVKVTVENVGEEDVGGAPVPLWGVNEDNVLLPAVDFTTRFRPCASQPLPRIFGPDDRVKTCLVYLAPDRGSLESVSFRPDQDFDPVEWTGEVEPPGEGSTDGGATGRDDEPGGGSGRD